MFSFKEIASVSLILFSIIDIVGAIPIIIDLRKKHGALEEAKVTLVSGLIMLVFLFVGDSILKLFGIDVQSFAIAGAIIIFLLGLEMILDKHFFQSHHDSTSTIVPLVFPLIAGAGTATTIISLKAEYQVSNILVGIAVNLVLIFIVLRLSNQIEKILGGAGVNVLRKVFGIVLISIAIKLFKNNLLTF
ncbi:MAG: MarC family protein [Cytophagales bacterium]